MFFFFFFGPRLKNYITIYLGHTHAGEGLVRVVSKVHIIFRCRRLGNKGQARLRCWAIR